MLIWQEAMTGYIKKKSLVSTLVHMYTDYTFTSVIYNKIYIILNRIIYVQGFYVLYYGMYFTLQILKKNKQTC